jgi:hypothetical protein
MFIALTKDLTCKAAFDDVPDSDKTDSTLSYILLFKQGSDSWDKVENKCTVRTNFHEDMGNSYKTAQPEYQPNWIGRPKPGNFYLNVKSPNMTITSFSAGELD